MKKFFSALCLALQIIKCFNCIHREDCPNSFYITYKKQQYRLTIEKENEEK